jgi:predicted amidophosphoribosyltransferase
MTCPRLAGFDQVWSALAYQYPVDRLIAEAKFGGQLATARALGELLALQHAGKHAPPGSGCSRAAALATSGRARL